MIENANISDVESALFHAVCLLDRMDRCKAYETSVDTPELALWAIEKLEPAIIVEIRSQERIGELMQLLVHYRSLRKTAENVRARWHMYSFRYVDDVFHPGFLTLNDVAYALENRMWKCRDIRAYSTLKRVTTKAAAHRTSEESRYVARWDIEAGANKCMHFLPTKPIPFGNELLAQVDSIAEQRAPLVNAALTHAKAILLACDDGSSPNFWHRNYTAASQDWLTHDRPQLAENILANGCGLDFTYALQAYITEMETVEDIWQSLSQPIRTLLLQSPTAEALEVIRLVSIEHSRVDANALETWSQRVWDMVKRRSAPPANPLSRVLLSKDSTDLLETIRSDERSHSTCFVVDTHKLPEELRRQVDEKYSLVVALPDEWLQAKDQLESQEEIRKAYAQLDDGELGTVICISRAFSCAHDELWPHLFRFRRVIPVVYVFKNQCGIVGYNFAHFTSLRFLSDIPRWQIEEMPSPADGISPVPLVASNVVDFATIGVGTPLAKAVEVEIKLANAGKPSWER